MHFEIYREKTKSLGLSAGLGTILGSTSGDWRWRLVANNGKIIADSGEGYRSRQHCEDGIALVKSTSSSTPIREML
ncbi:DUF1508 domain-containing protein [Pseudomonas luteola]|uniref:YegP family protein n=1 Tax=Pseudomonas luteola TaxID=47886 RepID=UPI000F78FE27|nr:DUF1508 domain-containing protein [Pseudomonas luteola]RRW46565.1 DUF1508 domain-containing protein [Pseudomonas luteola]